MSWEFLAIFLGGISVGWSLCSLFRFVREERNHRLGENHK